MISSVSYMVHLNYIVVYIFLFNYLSLILWLFKPKLNKFNQKNFKILNEMTTKLSNVSKPYSTLTSIVNEQLIKTANLMHIQYWITYNTYYVVVLWAICLSHFAKSELNCFPRGINPEVKRQHLILIFMLCFQIFWHPVMNSLSHFLKFSSIYG